MNKLSLNMTQKENVDYYFVYVLKASPNANHLKRVKAHAIKRELSTSVLDDSFILAIFENKNLKVDNHPICPIYIFLSP